MAHLSAERYGFVYREVMVEPVWVLERSCRFSRDRIATVLEEPVATEELVLEAAGDVARAARGFPQGRADFSDLVISAAARRSGALPICTFDRQATRLEGAELVGIQAIDYRPRKLPPPLSRRAGGNPAVVAGRMSLDGNRMRRTPSGGSGS